MKKVISLLLIAVLTVSVLAVPVSASSFKDLEPSQWDWAREAIEAMTEKGLVAGYSETEFGPSDGVTTLQAMLFMSRIIGFYESVNEDVLETAEELYGDFLSSYHLSNQSEIALLMYYDIFSQSELETYLSSSVVNKVLKRHEAAVFLTKTAGGENELKDKTLSFDDAAQIPDSSKEYVAYVVEKGYMLGMNDSEFGPDGEVTRAQMATMLYRVINDLDITYVSGEVETVSDTAVSVKTAAGAGKSYKIPSDAEIRINGVKKNLSQVAVGDDILLKFYRNTLRYADVFALESDTVTEGYVTSKKSGNPNQLKIVTADFPDGTEYPLAADCKIYYNGKTASFDDVLTGDNVTVFLTDGTVCKLEIAYRTDKVTSVEFAGIVYEPELGVITETSSGLQRTYLLDDKVTVRKNSKSAELKDLMVGDNLSLTLSSNKVTLITATSHKGSTSGTIEEIHISSEPYITVNNGKTSASYALNNQTEITVDGSTGTIYDLKLGYTVDVTLESDTVTKITTKVVQTTNTLMGTVDSVNGTYGFLYVYATDASGSGDMERIQVFTKKNNGTKIIDNKNDNGTRDLKKILSGESVLITGVRQTDGTFEASTIIILAD